MKRIIKNCKALMWNRFIRKIACWPWKPCRKCKETKCSYNPKYEGVSKIE